MALPKKPRKKKLNTRVIIAFGVALILGIILLMVYMQSKNLVSQVTAQNAEKEKQYKELQDKLKQMEDAQAIAQKTEAINANQKANERTNLSIVVVAKRNIPAGTIITDDMLVEENWSSGNIPENCYNFSKDLIGRMSGSDITKGEAILENKLNDKDMKMITIEPGFRAMTIPITATTGVGGYIYPGSRVDIISVTPKSFDKDSKTQEKLSQVLIQNVKVLATSAKLQDSGAKGMSSSPNATTLTVSVPINDAIKLALAFNNEDSAIQVVLRGYNDSNKILKTKVDSTELVTGRVTKSGASKGLPSVNLPKKPNEISYQSGNNMDLNSILNNSGSMPQPELPGTQTKTHSIELIQGNNKSEVSFETEM